MKTGGVSLVAALVVGSWAGLAGAQTAENEYGDYEVPPAERRSGFMIGLSLGPAYLDAVGYPNKLSEIDDPEFRQTFSGLGRGSSIWIGGAIRDWFSFAVGTSSRSDFERQLVGRAFVFRAEGFPLYSLGGEYRDLGVFGEFGGGGVSILDEEGEVVADAGLTSMLGLGVFYEPFTFWQFSSGPVLQYSREYSQSMISHAATLGWRLNFYWTQPRE